jgi:NAD+ kinase
MDTPKAPAYDCALPQAVAGSRMTKEPRLALAASDTPAAQAALGAMQNDHDWVPLAEADAVVVLGGDGFMLTVLHQMLELDHVVPAYGINYGTVGFMMNKVRSSRTIEQRVARATPISVTPLQMVARTHAGETISAYAINEVSLLRETRQTARLEITVNDKVRMADLACDGILVATPAGSTAYNLSANGPILPLGSQMLALTPISPFRPRRWKGAILPQSAEVSFRVLEPAKRPVAAVADQKEVRDIDSVTITAARDRQLHLLFDRGASLEERIFAEQFLV